MNCYTLTEQDLFRGIALVNGQVHLGEDGPGSVRVYWTPPQGSSVEGDRLVHVPIDAVYSDYSYGEAVLVALRAPQDGRGPTIPWWVVGTQRPNTRRAGGNRTWVLAPIHRDCAVLAEGEVADSPELLVRVLSGQVLIAKRTGRVYGARTYVAGIDFRGNTPAFMTAAELREPAIPG